MLVGNHVVIRSMFAFWRPACVFSVGTICAVATSCGWSSCLGRCRGWWCADVRSMKGVYFGA